MNPAGPHFHQPVLQSGTPLAKASGAIVFLHGRGGSAEDIMSLAEEIGHRGLAYFAPRAASNTWYPNSFLAPIEENQPWLNSALDKVAAVITLATSQGLPLDRVTLCGFSQGACLATEFVATNPARYAALIAFTGGLIGPPGSNFSHQGDLLQTPTFFGSGDPDPHVPWSRVEKSAAILTSMNAAVTLRRYPGRPHTISDDEISFARRLLAGRPPF